MLTINVDMVSPALSSLLAFEEEGYDRVFLLLSLTVHISLFPLLHQPAGAANCKLPL